MKKLVFSALIIFSTQLLYAQSWETVQGLPAAADARHHPATFTINGKGYLVTGADASSVSMGDFYEYDPNLDSWTTKTDFPGQARGFAYAVNSDTKGYLGFGYAYDPGNGIDQVMDDLWEYDPITDTWTELASCPGQARYHPAMVYLNGKIYMGLGSSGTADLGDWWAYDIQTDTWTPKATFPGADRHHPYYFGIGDYVYVGMGHAGMSIFDDLYRYDPQTDSWTQMQSLPSQGRVAGTQFSYNGKGYVLSGQGETHQNLPTGEFWEYDPVANDWTQLTAHPGGGRWAPGSFVINGNIFFMCGESNSGVKKDVLRYQIEGFATTSAHKENEQLISIYPNPAKNEFTFINLAKPAKLTIIDMSGKICWEAIVAPDQFVQIPSLQPGMFVCQLDIDGQMRRVKLTVK